MTIQKNKKSKPEKTYECKEEKEKRPRCIDINTLYNKIYLALEQGLPYSYSINTSPLNAWSLIDFAKTDEAFDKRCDLKSLREAALSVVVPYAQQSYIDSIAKDYMNRYGIIDFEPIESCEYTKSYTIVRYAQHRGLISESLAKYCRSNEIPIERIIEVINYNRKRIIDGVINSCDEEQDKEERALDINNTFDEMIANLPRVLGECMSQNGIVSGSFKKIEEEFHEALINKDETKLKELWKKYKKDKDLLEWAQKPVKDKYGDFRLKGSTICEMILFNYYDVDPKVYQGLIDTIFSYQDIARYRIQNQNLMESNTEIPFIVLCLKNPNLSLTEEQKAFAVNEALNCYGAVKYDEENPSSIANDGIAFDIRYWILRNENWSFDEKKTLVFDFWDRSEDYENVIDSWGIDLVNDASGCILRRHTFELSFISTYDERMIEEMFGDIKNKERIWEKVSLYQTATTIRPLGHQVPNLDSEAIIDEYLERICQRIDRVSEKVGVETPQFVYADSEDSSVSFDESLLCENPEYCKALNKTYKNMYDIRELRRIARKTALEYSRLQLSKRVAKCLLDINAMDDIEIPTSERERLLGKIFFFANRIGLVRRMLDYYDEVSENALGRVLQGICNADQLKVLKDEYASNGKEYRSLAKQNKTNLYRKPRSKWM